MKKIEMSIILLCIICIFMSFYKYEIIYIILQLDVFTLKYTRNVFACWKIYLDLYSSLILICLY